MRKVILFIAMSLDGYIADKQGSVDWLHGQDEDIDSHESYLQFIKNIDTVIMGWNTYDQIVSELSPDEWVYQDFMTYVMTYKKCKSQDNIKFTDNNLCELIKTLKSQKGKDIWICGGANIVQQLIKNNLIDQYYMSIIPILLGEGIALFQDIDQEVSLKLIETKSYNGIVDLIYQRKE